MSPVLVNNQCSPLHCKIKVCGIREKGDIEALSRFPLDYIGFIFFENSARYAGELPEESLAAIPPATKKVGVFVNATLDEIRKRIEQYHLEVVQLHGEESPVFCSDLRSGRVEVVKAFSIAGADDLRITSRYESVVDYFLFDTKTPLYGGSGKQFDWSVLQCYTGSTPFFLSGGIGPDDVERLQRFAHPSLYAVDVNSRFELLPGKKNTEQIEVFIHQIKSTNHE